jgi:hypothetical protein
MSSNIIQGNPTKSFFIQMITRDITINDAIVDLLDNSIDGASRINPRDYTGLRIDLILNRNEFIVKDNCGGFSIEIAQKYAFRFGRPDNAPETSGSVGRFGIGMKRALFKMGKNFIIESKTENEHFSINVDVEQWKNKTTEITLNDGNKSMVDDWNFSFENVTDTYNLADNGTYIKVSNLFTEVADLFADESFQNSLRNDIERLLNFSLEKNIDIYLNNQKLSSKDINIFNDTEGSKPYFIQGTKNEVRFKVIAGLGEVGNPSASGWYIYCNDRLVLEADQTEVTGWGIGTIPKWHIDFVMFRGVIFFDSHDTINLPLTTTKKGIDATAEIYKTVLPYMKEAMQKVIPFLRQITKLGDEANEYRKLLGEKENKISVVNMKATAYDHVERNFVLPELNIDVIAQKKDTIRIAYDVNKKIAAKAKNHSDSKSYGELGKYTFEYYLKMEELEDE